MTVLLGTPAGLDSELCVPMEYATIGEALAVARSGDTVAVAVGTYPECVSMEDGSPHLI